MKSVRACDSCIKKRARWYCAADDAFLCQYCDSSVHSANPLASRHERVLLKTASSRLDVSVPTWHKGFTRKARTPRQKRPNIISNPFNRVPDQTGSDENSHEENDEQLLYRVPTFEEFGQESAQRKQIYSHVHDYVDNVGNDGELSEEVNHLQGILQSDMDLDEFAADVESLLGKGIEDESFDMEGLGFLDYYDDRMKVEEGEIKGEFDDHHGVDNLGLMIDLGKETFELNFDCDSPINEVEEEDTKVWNGETSLVNNFEDCNSKKKTFLRINYDGVLSAWNHQQSPWTTGERPELDSDEDWPDCMRTCGTNHVFGEAGMFNGHATAPSKREREARVLRYKEKRRTRLFSKKIRYEVRKLNAEKRPRMKGRFVKRANLVAPAFTLLNK